MGWKGLRDSVATKVNSAQHSQAKRDLQDSMEQRG